MSTSIELTRSDRPEQSLLVRAAGGLADRLFAPHGAAAYLRWAVPAPTDVAATRSRSSVPVALPEEPDLDGSGDDTCDDVDVAEVAGVVAFRRSALQAEPVGTLLETAEAAGLSPRFRCRRGICGTCTTDKLDGTVVDARTGEVSSGAGPIRICVSVPRGDVALDL